MQETQTTKHRVIVCTCAGSDQFTDADRHAVLTGLNMPDAEVEVVADMCEIAAKEPEKLQALSDADQVSVVACYPRTVRSLFALAEVKIDEDQLKVHNLRTESAADVLTELQGPAAAAKKPFALLPQRKNDWVPWYPIIDPDRCVDCGQCLNFCLFGVYAKDENGKIKVTAPDACKTNCPACSRICPNVAIIFPKYPNAPINGAEVGDVKTERERIQVDMQELLGDNVHAALAERKRRKTELLKKKKQHD